ncbi:hypothetical protein ACFOLK_18905 [Marinococcus halophilus]|uniref:hypothetical protein n=1 Tax=Marinococcus halophilus TaxID=1371 RepID=UPI003613906C
MRQTAARRQRRAHGLRDHVEVIVQLLLQLLRQLERPRVALGNVKLAAGQMQVFDPDGGELVHAEP